MKRISPLNAKGSVENNVCPFINKKNSSPRVLCLWFFRLIQLMSFFLARVLLLKPFTGPMIFIFFADASSQLFT